MRRHIRFFVNGGQSFDLAQPLRAAGRAVHRAGLSGG